MKLESPYLKRGVRMEMTALMDVMFLVLVFFVYSVFQMAVHKGVKVDLPSAAGSHEKGERVVVTLRADDSLQLNGRSLSREMLIRETARLVKAQPEIPVLVSGDKNASLGSGISLLSELKAAGVDRVSFQVDGKNSR